MAVPTIDALRTLNLAYRHMQRIFRQARPELFRTKVSLTSDSTTGVIELNNDTFEVEFIDDSNNNKVGKINLEDRLFRDGYYHAGVSTTNDKRQIQLMKDGAVQTSETVTVYYLKEYADLSATSDTPYPFVEKAYLDILTTLQAWYYYGELGTEHRKDKQDMWANLKKMLPEEMFTVVDLLDDEATYGTTSNSDAGNRLNYPVLTPSTS